MELLTSFLEISTVQDNYTYTSPKKKSNYLWTLLFGFLTGDVNPIHINPFTAVNYKSRLGGLARHGISTLAQAESFIFKIFSFKEPTEIIAKGYNKIRYLRPVNIGNKMTYTYTLLQKKIVEEKKYAECVWSIQVTDQRNENVLLAEWVVIYSPVQENIVKTYIRPFYWFGHPIEVHSTPTNIFIQRLFAFICGGVILWLLAHAYLD